MDLNYCKCGHHMLTHVTFTEEEVEGGPYCPCVSCECVDWYPEENNLKLVEFYNRDQEKNKP